jgi:hypothetical protein
VSVFDGKSKQQIKDDANPGATIHLDGKTQSLARGLHLAMLESVGVAKAASMTPTERMKVEHARLFKAFRDAEDRDPDANGDPEFWDAHATISKSRGQSVGDITAPALDLDGGLAEPVAKVAGHKVGQQLRKRLAEGPGPDEPAWIQSVLKRNGV